MMLNLLNLRNKILFLSTTLFLCVFFLDPPSVSAQVCPHSSCTVPGQQCCYNSTVLDVFNCQIVSGNCQPVRVQSSVSFACDTGPSCQTNASVCSSNDDCINDAYGCRMPSSCSNGSCCGAGSVSSTSTPTPGGGGADQYAHSSNADNSSGEILQCQYLARSCYACPRRKHILQRNGQRSNGGSVDSVILGLWITQSARSAPPAMNLVPQQQGRIRSPYARLYLRQTMTASYHQRKLRITNYFLALPRRAHLIQLVTQFNASFIRRVAHIAEEVLAARADHPAHFLAGFGRHQQRDGRTDQTPYKDPDQKAKHAFHGILLWITSLRGALLFFATKQSPTR